MIDRAEQFGYRSEEKGLPPARRHGLKRSMAISRRCWQRWQTDPR